MIKHENTSFQSHKCEPTLSPFQFLLNAYRDSILLFFNSDKFFSGQNLFIMTTAEVIFSKFLEALEKNDNNECLNLIHKIDSSTLIYYLNRNNTIFKIFEKPGFVAVVEKLITLSFELKNGKFFREKALSHTCKINEFYEYAKVIIKNTKDLDNGDSNGWTPLMWAADKNNYKALIYLIHKGAKLNLQDLNGRTSIYWAVHFARYETLRFLLKRKADVNINYGKIQNLSMFEAFFSSRILQINNFIQLLESDIKIEFYGDKALKFAKKKFRSFNKHQNNKRKNFSFFIAKLKLVTKNHRE